MIEISEEVRAAHKKAINALKNSHAPYSKLSVASALKLDGVGEVIIGVNVENASYGATICAERSAICSATSQYGKKEFSFIVVISNYKGGPIPPCGMCLQVLGEFVSKDFPVYLGNEKEIVEKYLFSQLVPHQFDGEMLP